MDQRQSEAIAGAVHDAVRGSVATLHDLTDAKNDLKAELAEAKNELKLEIQSIRADLTVLKWMCATIVASALALVAKAFF